MKPDIIASRVQGQQQLPRPNAGESCADESSVGAIRAYVFVDILCALCADMYSDCMRSILMSDDGRVRASALDENQQTQTAFTLAASRFVRERRQTNLPV